MGKIIVILGVILLGIAAGWLVRNGPTLPKLSKTSEEIPTNPPTGEPTPTITASGMYEYREEKISGGAVPTGPAVTKGGVVETPAAVAKNTVSYTDSGFTPGLITVKVNTQITFVNNSTGNMWVVSTGQALSGFDQKNTVAKGGIYTYTFSKIGTWQYRNNAKTTDTGVVVVTR